MKVFVGYIRSRENIYGPFNPIELNTFMCQIQLRMEFDLFTSFWHVLA